MDKIKIKFVDFWRDFNPEDNYLYLKLSQWFDLTLSENPDYIIYSSFGFEHLKYQDCVKIYYTGENDVPDFNFCDYALGFQHLIFEDRYLRYPLYLLYKGYDDLRDKQIGEAVCKRKFCNFVYSNHKYSTPLREDFFYQLSKYKKIDSGGRFLNNIGSPVVDKLAFIKDYKFTIAFENSSQSGYTTEKIMEPMTVNSMPIYWGDPNVSSDFNQESFVNLQSYPSFESAIEEIIRLDNDDQAYLEKLSRPWLTDVQADRNWKNELYLFFMSIFEQEKKDAIRRPLSGFVVAKKQKEMKFAKYSTSSLLQLIIK